jgi:multidrug transporter EmrE-like cation transporter
MTMPNLLLKIGLLLFYTVISVAGMVQIKGAEAILTARFISGFTLYVVGFFIWIGIILRLLPLSSAFPIAAGSLMVGTQIAGWLFLNERMSAVHFIGVAMIMAGVVTVGLANQVES